MTLEDTLKERGNRYGTFKDNAQVTQELMGVIKQYGANYDKLTDMHVEALHMIFHKIARCVSGDVNYPDNFEDIAGYATRMKQELDPSEDIKKQDEALQWNPIIQQNVEEKPDPLVGLTMNDTRIDNSEDGFKITMECKNPKGLSYYMKFRQELYDAARILYKTHIDENLVIKESYK